MNIRKIDLLTFEPHNLTKNIFAASMKKAFATNILFLLAVNLLIKPFYLFGIDRTVQNVVGPETFGLFWALFNFVYIFQVINDLGIYNFNATFISQNRHLVNKYFGHIALLKLITATAFFLFVTLAFWLMSYGWSYLNLLIPICINQILVSFIFFMRSNISGLGKYRLDSFISVLDKILMIVICSFLLWGPISDNFDILWFIYAQTASLLLTLLISIFLLRPYLQSWKLHWHKPTIIAFIKKAMPFALVLVLTTIYTRVDAVMLERMLEDGQYQSGVYVSGYRLLDAANMISFLFASLLLPMFAFQMKEKKDVSPLFQISIGLNVFIAISATTIAFLFAKPVMSLLYTHATSEWSEVMKILMSGYVFMGISYICGALLLASSNVNKLNWVYLSGMLLNVVVNYFLIPEYGALGAAWATLITQAVVALSSLILVIHLLGIKLSLGWITRLLILFLTGIVLISFFSQWAIEGQWIFNAIIIGLLFVVLGSVLGLIPFRTLMQRGESE